MAYNTTQTLDTLLLRGLNFRTPANAAISSQYTLYANGGGQTYWSNSISPTDLSTLSTTIQTNISSMTSTLQYQSTVTGNVNAAYISTTNGFWIVDQGFSNVDAVLRNNIIDLSTSTDTSLSNVYTYIDTSILGISTYSTFYNQISAVQSSVNTSVSSLSTALYIQNASTYSSLTANYLAADNNLWNSTLSTVNQQISTLSSVVAYEADLSTLSTTLTSQLLSTTLGVNNYTDSQIGSVNSTISTIYFSSIIPFQSTTVGLSGIFLPFAGLSTNFSSITGNLIYSSITVNNVYVYSTIYGLNSSLNTSLSSLSSFTYCLSNSYSTFSTNYVFDLSTTNGLITNNASSITGLQLEFNVITTSSILLSIYKSFVDLEYYTSSLIGSTNTSFANFESQLVSTTGAQNVSSSTAFFNAYVSSLYTSTLSTVVPLTISYVSSLVSTLYSTSYTYLISSLNSTTTELVSDFNSTISSYTYIYISTVEDNYNSSVLQYLSAPSACLLSTYSSLNYMALTCFQSTSVGQLAFQSTLFDSTFSYWDSSFTSLDSTTTSYIYIQSSIITSTLTGYPSTLTYYLNSTNTYILNYTSIQANNTLINISNSTNTTYNAFVADLQAASSTAALSSLYTYNNIDLSSTTSTATMDLASYRNFYINIYNIIDGTPYVVNYYNDTISTLDYRSGIITLNISTVGSAYTYNGGRLRLDVNRWGIPTATMNSLTPYISSAAYTVQYQYNIINSIVNTSLLNIYPVLAIQNPYVNSSTTLNVYISSLGMYSSSAFWRGSPITVSWTNYTFYPYLSTLNMNVDILIDVVVAGSTISSYGPYPFSQSTTTIYAPYLKGQISPVISTCVDIYVAGLESQSAVLTFNTMIPGFDDISLTPFGYPGNQSINHGYGPNWMGGTELLALTDAAATQVLAPPLYNLTPIVTTNNTSIPNPYLYYNNNPQYSPSNFLNGVFNTLAMYGTFLPVTNVSAITGTYQFYDETILGGPLSLRFNMPGNYLVLLPYLIQNVSITVYIFDLTTGNLIYNSPISDIVNNGDGTYSLQDNTIAVPLFTNVGDSCIVFISVGTIPINEPGQVMAALTSVGYTPSTFVGPSGHLGLGGPPYSLADELAYTDIQPYITSNALFTSITIDAVSTLTYYNFSTLGNTPNDIYNHITSNATTGMSITGSVYYNGDSYQSSFITTNSDKPQVFHI